MTTNRQTLRHRIADILTRGALSQAQENNRANRATCARLAADLSAADSALTTIAEAIPTNAQARQMIETARQGLNRETQRNPNA